MPPTGGDGSVIESRNSESYVNEMPAGKSNSLIDINYYDKRGFMYGGNKTGKIRN